MAYYDLNTDYQKLMEEAAKKGDLKAAAKYEEQRNAKIAALDADGTNVYGAAQSSKYSRYRDPNDPIVPESGLYTKDQTAAEQAAAYHGVSVTPTNHRGEDGWYEVGSAKPNRVVQTGTSGADEGLLGDAAYAEIQTLKQRYAAQQKLYEQALAGGDTAAVQAARGRMDSIHARAEDIRAKYHYSGGTDGGDYIPLGSAGQEEDDGWYDEDSHPVRKEEGTGSARTPAKPDAAQSVLPTIPAVELITTRTPQGAIPVPEAGDLSAGVEDYSEYLRQMNAAQQAAALAELKAAYDRNVAAVDRAGAGLDGVYQAARNQAAAQSEQEKRSFAQYAAATGLNSGASGQAELARGMALQGSLNTINTEQANALADLELQRANAEVEYNSAVAQAEAAGDYQLAADLYEEKVRVQEALTQLQIRQQQFALQQYQLKHQAQQDDFANRLAADKFTYQQLQGAYDNQLAADRFTYQQQQQAGENRLAWEKFLFQKQQEAIANQLAQDKLTLQAQQYAASQSQNRQEDAAAQSQKQAAALAESGWKYLSKGAMPTAAMLSAMGLTQTDAQRYISALAAK